MIVPRDSIWMGIKSDFGSWSLKNTPECFFFDSFIQNASIRFSAWRPESEKWQIWIWYIFYCCQKLKLVYKIGNAFPFDFCFSSLFSWIIDNSEIKWNVVPEWRISLVSAQFVLHIYLIHSIAIPCAIYTVFCFSHIFSS